jgi:hypothetical protein
MTIGVSDHVSYLREHSVGSILRSSLQIYRRNFLSLFLIYSLPAFPFTVAQQEAQATGRAPLALVLVLVNLFVGFFAFGAITVAISDICLGDRPGVIRSYRRLGGATMRRLMWSNFLQIVVVALGLILLVIPGLILMVRLLFTSVVATLENVSGRAALTRSATLGKGFYWRNTTVLLLFIAVFGLVGGLAGLFFALISMGVGADNLAESSVARTLIAISMLSLYPLGFTCITLMYYDLRVRKEAYDLRALAEDLRR